ncbi:MAG: hypothetical protein HYU47_02320 [Deltaproteobacteria bacterium]|nr:hypothetical protein [Deltaproteobacteria bacterium]
METKSAPVDRSILRRSAFWYAGTSLGVVVLFLTLTELVGGYRVAAVVGGAIWSFILSMIVTMPLYTAFFKRKLTR